MSGAPIDEAGRLAGLLGDIARAEAAARRHDLIAPDHDAHAEAAQRADEAAEAARRAARALIEGAFPGVSWSRIAAASL